MKTLAVRNRDLVLVGNKLGMVEGAAKLQQQVGLALKEPYGSDRFHSTWGSSLNSLIGSPMTAETQTYVRAEVVRVLRDYIAAQGNMMADRSARALKANVSPSEIVFNITDVRVDQRDDSLSVRFGIVTADRQQIDVMTKTGG